MKQKVKLKFVLLKKLKGRELFNNEFKFNLSRDGKIERVATNRGDGSVTFSGLEFTGDDAGHERVYEISEMDTKAGGIQYDGHKEIVRITVEDNGDGTMRTNIVYDSDGANFNNVYEARGKVSLKAWKEIKGGKLEDGAFEFVVKDGEKVMARGRNDKNGTINFSEMEFTQDDVGKTFNLIASEVVGNDDKITYDNTTINYTIEVRDNFDGTLSFNVSARDNFVADINNDRSTPMFVNKYKDGSLAIEKVAPNGSNEEFRFRVTLRGENLPSGRGTVRRENVDNSNVGVTNTILGGLRNALVGIFTPKVAKAADDAIPQPSGAVTVRGEDGVPWELYENGYLLFKPEPGKDTLSNYDKDARVVGGDSWKRLGSSVKYVGFSDKTYAPANSRYLFSERSGARSLKFKPLYIDTSKLDTSKVTDMSGMFYNSTELKTLDVSKWDTSKVTDMSTMFYNTYSLRTLDVKSWDTSNVTTMASMFNGDRSLMTLDLSSWNTGRVKNIYSMFTDTRSLVELNLGGWNTSEVTSSDALFQSYTSESKLLKITLPSMQSGWKAGVYIAPIKSNKYTDKWVREDGAFGPYTWKELGQNWRPEMAGTWVREKVRTDYTIEFNTDGTGESMTPIKVEVDQEAKLPTPGIRKPGSKFKGWSKTQGGNILTNFRYLTTPGQKVTLYAIWDTIDNNINIQNGTFEVSVFGNERVTLEGLPAGIEYQVEERTKDGWVLVGEYNTSGTIKPKETSTARFVNTNTLVASAGIKARKLLDGKAAGGFEFELVQDGTVKGKVTSNGDGSINFDRITYNNPGEFDYTIREVQGTDSAITYDTSIKRVHVSVTRNGSKLVANVTYPNGVVFNNSIKTGSIKVSKRVIDNTDYKRDFTFIMTLNGREEQFNLRNGQEKVFSGIKYGTTYKVQEVNIPSEYTLASLTNAEGTVSSNQEIDVVATNQYKTNGSFTVNAKKVLQNRPLKSGEFTFELVDENGQVVDSVNNAENGEVTFNAISVNSTGVRIYKIREKVGSDENIKYDTHEETVRVVTTNTNGRTETRVEYDTDGAVFTNKYEPKVVTTSENAVNVLITKKLEGSSTNRLFNLKVDIMKDGKALESAFEYNSNLDATVKTLTPGGKIEIRKDETITIKNVPQGAKVKVVEDSYAGYRVKEGTEITKDVTVDDNSLVVTNIYEARGELSLKGRKTLIGGDISDYRFNFLVLRDGDIVSQGTNNGSEIEFKPLTFTNKDIGKTYEYDVIEDAGSNTRINYDGTVHKLRVTVEDNGDGTLRVTSDNALDIAFNNSIKADLPVTGGFATVLILVGLSGSLGVAVLGRRRKYL